MKFNSLKLIYLNTNYRKYTKIKENEIIFHIKIHSNVISEIKQIKTSLFHFQL